MNIVFFNVNNYMSENTHIQLGFLKGVLDELHKAIGREAIARDIDLTLDQVEMIKDICTDIKSKVEQL